MKRIDILYGGDHYSVGGADLAQLQARITDAVARGGDWIVVNEGEGSAREAYLLVGPGVPIALVPVPIPAPREGEQPWEDGAPNAEVVA